MSTRKKRKYIKEILAIPEDLNQQIAEAVEGLIYLSETDSKITVITGQKANTVTVDNLLTQIELDGRKVEEKGFDEFFAPLIKIQNWFGANERKMTEKFVALKDLLQQNLIQKKVFKIGKIQIDIFVVGLDKDNVLRGIQTKGVET